MSVLRVQGIPAEVLSVGVPVSRRLTLLRLSTLQTCEPELPEGGLPWDHVQEVSQLVLEAVEQGTYRRDVAISLDHQPYRT